MVESNNVPVFVGSTYSDLVDYRNAVMEVLHKLQVIVKGMEYFGARPGKPIDECLKEVGCSKIYIGIFAMRYGSIEESTGKSFTHLEYLEAQRLGLPSLIYLIDEEKQPLLPKNVDKEENAKILTELKEVLKKSCIVSSFTTPENLAKQISQDLPSVLETLNVPQEWRATRQILREKKVKLVQKSIPSKYLLISDIDMKDNNKMIAKKHFGKSNINNPIEKVLLIVGETGSGKTTLINGMINYILGVEWEDDFRFQLITEEQRTGAQSQTQFITAYHICQIKDSRLPYNITIIDTPGFNDTSGLKRDKFIISQIKEFFSQQYGITKIDGVGFVVQASSGRLTPSQDYVYKAIMAIFGKDIASNIFLLVTFCDGQKPPVLEAVKAANMPYQQHFKFNNSALFAENRQNEETDDENDDENFDKMFWKMGEKSFKTFFSYFENAEPVSLQLTKEVLHERKQLETTILGLRPRIDEGLSKMEELRQTEVVVAQREKEIEQNKDFKFTVTRTLQRKISAPKGIFNTTCLKCHKEPCHYDCAYHKDEDKHNCSAMNSAGYCTVCGCHWSVHANTPYIYESYEGTETITSNDLLEKYNIAVKEKNKTQKLQDSIHQDLLLLANDVFLKTMQVQTSLSRLEEIALKPDPLTSEDYLNLLIEDEKTNKKTGWKQRVEYYEEAKEQARLVFGIRNNNAEDVKKLNHVIQDIQLGKKKKSDIGVDFSKWVDKLRFW